MAAYDSWTSVDDERPEIDGLVNILTANGLIRTARRIADRKDGHVLFNDGGFKFNDVICWSRIPVRPSYFKQRRFDSLRRVV